MKKDDDYKITRQICPRNCHDSCGILTRVKNGVIQDISGDPQHGYSKGCLCMKGLTYRQEVYSEARLRYPLLQHRRGSGQWQEISWDEAMERIATKILEIKDRYDSTLPLCLNKFSGNMGLLSGAVEGMFSGFGPTTRAQGSPCSAAGRDAQILDMGASITSDISQCKNARLIVLWGINPAWTALHSWPDIYQAQEQGAKILTIDPLFTLSAKKSDYYLQIKPGQDSALALAIIKYLIVHDLVDHKYIERYTKGWLEFREVILNQDETALSDRCGQRPETIVKIARLMSQAPLFIWVGKGIQRYREGGQAVRLIDAIGAMTGNIGRCGGGVQFSMLGRWPFSGKISKRRQDDRLVNINSFAKALEALDDPPVKFLWVAGRNLLERDVDLRQLKRQLQQLEMIVTVDLRFTVTALYSDIVLPATTLFEHTDVVASYWQNWLGVSEQAIEPYFAAKSDLEIAQLLTRTLNNLRPGSADFPLDKSAAQFLEEEFTPAVYESFGINNWTELQAGPRYAKISPIAWDDKKFTTASGKFEFIRQLRQPASISAVYPYCLLTPHTKGNINSQANGVDIGASEPLVLLHPSTAAKKNVAAGGYVRIYNEWGEIVIKTAFSQDIAPDILVIYQVANYDEKTLANQLIGNISCDLGSDYSNFPGLAVYDTFVDFVKI